MMETAKHIYMHFNAGRDIRSKVAIELRNSYPIPIRDGDNYYWRAFYFSVFFSPPATQREIYPPGWSAALSADGHLMNVDKLAPVDYGLVADPDQPLGTHSYVELGREDGSPIDRVEHLLAAYDPVVAAWSTNENPETPAARNNRAVFRRWFFGLAEPFFLPVYRRIGADFFDWIEK